MFPLRITNDKNEQATQVSSSGGDETNMVKLFIIISNIKINGWLEIAVLGGTPICRYLLFLYVFSVNLV